MQHGWLSAVVPWRSPPKCFGRDAFQWHDFVVGGRTAGNNVDVVYRPPDPIVRPINDKPAICWSLPCQPDRQCVRSIVIVWFSRLECGARECAGDDVVCYHPSMSKIIVGGR